MEDEAGAATVRAELAALSGPASPANGRFSLSSHEQEVAALIAEGLTNRQIGERLIISERTVDNDVQRILARLGAQNQAQIAVWVAARRV